MASKLLNLALYQTGWFCCVLGAAQNHPWLSAVDFGVPAWRSLLVLGAVWAVAIPTLLRLAGAARGATLQIGYRGLS